jgi:hypothetical protein
MKLGFGELPITGGNPTGTYLWESLCIGKYGVRRSLVTTGLSGILPPEFQIEEHHAVGNPTAFTVNSPIGTLHKSVRLN